MGKDSKGQAALKMCLVDGDRCPNTNAFRLRAWREGNDHVDLPHERKTSMKTSKKLVGILTVTTALLAQAEAQTFLTDGLVAYYPFNGNANDASGHGNNGTVVGATLTQDMFGVANSAYSFDGLSDYVTVPDFAQADANAHTLSLWIQAKAWTILGSPKIYEDFLDKDNAVAGQRQWDCQGTQTGQIKCAVFTSEGEYDLDSISQLQTNQWYHVVTTWDGTNESVFINGIYDSSIPAPGNLVQVSAPVTIGANPGFYQFFDGKLDQVRIYDRALSSNEVTQLYAYDLTNSEPATAATAIATMENGFVVGTTITDGGFGYTNTPTVRIIGGGGTGAQAVAVVSNEVVTAIDVLDAGSDYTNTPVVVIEPPFIFNPVLGIAPMTFLTFSNLTVGGVYQLQQAVEWYWTNQPFNFRATNSVYTQIIPGAINSGDYRLALSPVPAQAFAVPKVANGFVIGATLTSGGSGYVTSPPVSIISEDGGSNATAVSQISGGVVTNIIITSAGVDYTNTPIVEIGPPPVAAVSPAIVLPMVQLNSASLAPYDNYQIQFTPTLGATWVNWNAGLFSPTAATNSQYLFVTNATDFFRLQYVP